MFISDTTVKKTGNVHIPSWFNISTPHSPVSLSL